MIQNTLQANEVHRVYWLKVLQLGGCEAHGHICPDTRPETFDIFITHCELTRVRIPESISKGIVRG